MGKDIKKKIKAINKRIAKANHKVDPAWWTKPWRPLIPKEHKIHG